jgi:hypothetical protein
VTAYELRRLAYRRWHTARAADRVERLTEFVAADAAWRAAEGVRTP